MTTRLLATVSRRGEDDGRCYCTAMATTVLGFGGGLEGEDKRARWRRKSVWEASRRPRRRGGGVLILHVGVVARSDEPFRRGRTGVPRSPTVARWGTTEEEVGWAATGLSLWPKAYA